MDAFFHFLTVLIECVAGLIALAVVLAIVVWLLPNSPLKQIVREFTKRVGATAAVVAVGIPLQPILGIDEIYDIGGLILLAIYWYGMIAKIRMAQSYDERHAHISEATATIPQAMNHWRNLRK